MYFSCIDDYFTDYNNRRRAELGQAFGPSLAGGGLAFLLDGSQIAACMQVAAGCVIDGTTDFYIISHVDCGAYKYFAGIDWGKYTEEVQAATLWRDLHTAEAIAREFLANFNNPADSDWKVPDVKFHLEVVNLQEENVPGPESLDQALDYSNYRGIKLPADK